MLCKSWSRTTKNMVSAMRRGLDELFANRGIPSGGRRTRAFGGYPEPLEDRALLTAVPDFAIPDVNSTSNTFSQLVSPRDYEGMVSAWYFGHST